MHGYVLVYSIGARASFDKLKLINEKLLNMLGSKPPRVLVGSMSDLEKSRQVVLPCMHALAVSWTRTSRAAIGRLCHMPD